MLGKEYRERERACGIHARRSPRGMVLNCQGLFIFGLATRFSLAKRHNEFV